MSSPGSLEDQLDVTYRYFSHHIRTCTSVVVAMLDAVAEGLTDESMTAMIMESGYLLDIYDRGMSVCFNHILKKPHDLDMESVDLGHLLDLYIKNAVSAESSVQIENNVGSVHVFCDAYSFKSLFQILLQEALSSAKKKLTVTLDSAVLTVIPDGGLNEIQKIFPIFAEILKRSGIMMEYDRSCIKLRFKDESIDS